MKTRLKLLHVITTLSRGGAENHLVDLVAQQTNLGYQITIAYLQREGYWRDKLQALGVQVIDLGLPLRSYGDPRPAIKLRSLIKSVCPDIVHAHLPPAELYTRLALWGTSSCTLPLVISKHNTGPFYKSYFGMGQRWLGRWTAKRANCIIAISEAVKNQVHKTKLVPLEKLAVIHYGIDPSPYQRVGSEAIQRLRHEWGVANRDYLIGTVARFEPEKALHVLLEGFAFYSQKATRCTKLVMVGTGSLEAKLRGQATKLGIQEQVIWAGFREDIPVVMNALDLVTLTSVREGFGLILLEAMAAAKPVVASNVSAIPEVVVNQVTGKLVSPRRADLLAKAFQYFEDDEIRAGFGVAARERVKANFTLSQMTEKTTSVYEICFNNRNKCMREEPEVFSQAQTSKIK